MQVLELLTFLPISNTFLSLSALSCPFLLFSILSSPLVDGWMGGREDRHTDGRTYRRMDGQTELNSIKTDIHHILLSYMIKNKYKNLLIVNTVFENFVCKYNSIGEHFMH